MSLLSEVCLIRASAAPEVGFILIPMGVGFVGRTHAGGILCVMHLFYYFLVNFKFQFVQFLHQFIMGIYLCEGKHEYQVPANSATVLFFSFSRILAKWAHI